MGWNFHITRKMAKRIASDIMIATAMPAGVMPLDESFLELVGVSAAVRGFVGIGEADVDEVLEVIVEEVELEVVVVVGSDEEDSELVVVWTAGSSIVVVSSLSFGSSFGSSLGSSFGVGVGLDGPSSGSAGVGVGVGAMSNRLVTKLSRGSRN